MTNAAATRESILEILAEVKDPAKDTAFPGDDKKEEQCDQANEQRLAG